MTVALPMTMSWSADGTSIRMDVICLIVALAIHTPLIWVKVDMKKATVDRKLERLVQVDMLDKIPEKPVAPPKPVAKKKKGTSLFDRLQKLVKKAPPPPPPPKKKLEPKKLNMAPKEIKLQPKLKSPDALKPKLVTKKGFESKKADMIKKTKKISLASLGSGKAPLSASKVGVIKDRAKVKQNRGSFQVSKTESLKGIGGGPGIADPSAPTIAIKTGRKGSTEKFSAAPRKASKGKFGGGSAASLGGNKALGLRDRIIARDAAPAQIVSSNRGRTGGVPGGVPGGTGTKQDRGSFSGGSSGSLGGTGTGRGIGRVASTKKVAAIAPKKRRKKKEMFTITGELKDRGIQKRVIPEYPGWAQAKGIEAAVILEFTVTPNGKVKNNIVVRRTSGYPRLDQSALKALRKWLFVPLADGSNRQEVGMITFNYSLS